MESPASFLRETAYLATTRWGSRRTGKERFWIYMACGLARISDSELQRWLRDPGTNVNPRVLDVFDGVRTGRAPFSPMALSSDGRIWFANGFSVGMVDPARLAENAAPPPVHIESVIADHKTYSLKQGMRLPALTRDLEIDYTALSLGAPQKVYFRYRLEGRESDWQQRGNPPAGLLHRPPARQLHLPCHRLQQRRCME